MPDRVMRQFGYPQLIPLEPIKPLLVCRPPQPSLYRCTYALRDSFEDFYTSRCNFGSRSIRAPKGPEVIDDYLNWFPQRTHMQVTRPELFHPRQHFEPADMDPSVVCFLNIQYMYVSSKYQHPYLCVLIM